jgi:hypothetical protein
VALLALFGGVIWVNVAAAPPAAPPPAAPPPAAGAPPAQPAGDAQPQQTYPRLAPYSGVRWATPQVEFDGVWYELLAISDTSVAEIVQFAQERYGPAMWQKRFDEDLVEILTLMGKPPGDTVKLKLRPIDGGEPITRDAPMTHQNREAIWQSRYEAERNVKQGR